MQDLTVTLEDRPGTLADLGEATGRAGINIEGISGTTQEGPGAIHILVQDAAAARAVLDEAGIEVGGERDVLVVDVEDHPGTMGEVARRIASAGVNIELVYTTFGAVRLSWASTTSTRPARRCSRTSRARAGAITRRGAFPPIHTTTRRS
jgi:hypothetical protein